MAKWDIIELKLVNNSNENELDHFKFSNLKLSTVWPEDWKKKSPSFSEK